MDWLDEILEKGKARINHLPLKRALMVYIVICIIVVITLSAVTQSVCLSWDNYIWSKYSREKLEMEAGMITYYQDVSQLNRLDRILVEVIDFTQSWSTILYSIAGILIVSYLFSRHKLAMPLSILQDATDKVSRNDLDLDLYYDSRDEMGDLCRSFDLMRKKLIENNQKMWDMMEEQKRLNAAFAHDLRTPLTVLRGYTDLLIRYIPDGRISQDKLISTLKMMSEQLTRLENYSNTMKEISSLEEHPLNPGPITVMELEQKLRIVTDVLDLKNGIRIKLFNSIFEDRTLSLDETIILEVFHNLMSNAVRYAGSEIEVILSLSEDSKQLILSVADDGKGFSRTDLVMAVRPYYTEAAGQKSEHFGIGLYICRILCEKHKGSLTLANQSNGGAIVTAVFEVNEKIIQM